MQYPPHPPISDVGLHGEAPVQFEWDAWNPYASIGDPDLRVQALLRSVSDRAKIAFAIACAEWVVGRLTPWLDGDSRPWQYIEACWLHEMSDEFALPVESEESQWQGNVRAPIDLALMTILNVAIGCEDDNAEVDAAFAAKLATHVLIDKRAFLHWQISVLHRLRRLYPLAQEFRMGPPVPRAVLVEPFALNIDAAEVAVQQFINRALQHPNPFRVSASEPGEN
jgi:hypothetical protein